jgi:hypothetical protein
VWLWLLQQLTCCWQHTAANVLVLLVLVLAPLLSVAPARTLVLLL